MEELVKSIDCRNMACPQPVVAVKRALAERAGEPLNVLLDAGAPRENVTRFAVNRGFTVEETPINGAFSLVITGAPQENDAAVMIKAGKTVMLIASDRLGDGPEELGRLLMKNFIITLLDMAAVPDLMLFVNTGVLLTTEGSEVLEALEKLGNCGVEVFSCGVCLDFFQRKDKLATGAVTNMFSIAESLLQARSVIRI
jgi:selenium metabolism protein YedF